MRIWSLVALILTLPAAAQAQAWPQRGIEMILPFAAGGGVDTVGRAVAEALSRDLGQQVVVRNQVGAAGTIGFGALARAEPTGYTIGFGPTTPITNAPHMMADVRYGVDSFDYVCQVFENVFTLAVRPASPYATAQDLLSAAERAPGTLAYGHAGVGSIPHLSVESLSADRGLRFNPVAFRGDSDILPVLLKGDLHFAAPAVSSIKGQEFRVLAVFSPRRHEAYPDAPTVGELGIANPVPPGFNGLYAPRGLPPAVRQSLEAACRRAVDSDVVRRVTSSTGQTVSYLDGAAFRDRAGTDYQGKGELIRRLGLSAR